MTTWVKPDQKVNPWYTGIMNPTTQSPQPSKFNNPLNSMQIGEREIFAIKRHPIGIITMYFSVGLALLLLGIIIFAVLPTLLPSNRDQIMRFGAGLYLIVLLMVMVFVVVSHAIYWGNRWILTSDSLTQITQTGLFNKQSSQLSLANLEDVTAKTNGILANMFNFGILKAETAGERSKFTFIYCPDPEKCAQQILMAREQFEQGRHYEAAEAPPQTPTQIPPATA